MRRICARAASSTTASGSGTDAVIGNTASGLVPQVTMGAIAAASSRSVLS